MDNAVRVNKGAAAHLLMEVPTVFVNGEGHVGGDDLVVADLAELERAVGIHRLHLQDAVVLLSFDDGGFVGLLLEHWGIFIDVVHLDVHGGPESDKIGFYHT